MRAHTRKSQYARTTGGAGASPPRLFEGPRARGKTIEQADRYSLREAAEVVSKALKRTQEGQGSITAQGLRKWVLQGFSPYDWKLTAHFGRVIRFPADLLKADVLDWTRLFMVWRLYQGAEQFGRQFGMLNELLADYRKHGIKERGPNWPESCCMTFDDWADRLRKFIVWRGPTA